MLKRKISPIFLLIIAALFFNNIFAIRTATCILKAPIQNGPSQIILNCCSCKDWSAKSSNHLGALWVIRGEADKSEDVCKNKCNNQAERSDYCLPTTGILESSEEDTNQTINSMCQGGIGEFHD